ncbi:type II toxin-antitoxin system RelE/ParE family toxin [Singulisphaera acidiphila]|uniref:Phage-related protein n=1 Tax=Singulisphaera acidiphila (strain ATCC BAA-1392 / DSM 18658 / VKM B-2454 / MOB10) TaxID=886293 RepID=L0DT44_SINAD|nr:type II toxin-antitoxin system RelE/ParE family toxin [Singulisphaera acidiphila]AGA31536.1 phage-related protein [Singulisphaera acidiphila DSM 18658]
MPEIEIRFYREVDDSVPLLDWLVRLPAEARDRCIARLSLLVEKGHELRRPHAENIGDGLYELRVKFYSENLRMLYFFHGRTITVVSHGFSKERKIPPGEIQLAKARMDAFKAEPERHTFRPPADEE